MKFLLFTSIENGEVEFEEFTKERVSGLAHIHGIKEEVFHESIPLGESMAMNGSILYAEIISPDYEALNVMAAILFNTGIRNRDAWDAFIASHFPSFKGGFEQDSYVFSTTKEYLDTLNKEIALRNEKKS